MKSKNIWAILLTCVTFALSIWLIIFIKHNDSGFEKILNSTGIFAPMVTILIYGILSLTPIPSDPLTLLCPIFFGPIGGILVSWLGNTFAAVVEYLAGMGVSAISDFESKKSKLPWGLDKLPVESPWFLIGGRFVPGFGSKIVSIMAGVYGVNIVKYIWTAAAANIVGSVMYSLWGIGIYNVAK